MIDARACVKGFSSRNAKAKFRRALVGCELLESRQLLAVDMLAMVCLEESAQAEISSDNLRESVKPTAALPVATHSYFVGTEQVNMHVHPNRIALSVAKGHAATDALEASGFKFVRGIDADFNVYETTDDAATLAANLKANGVVSDELPVFVLQSSQSEAVLVDEVIVSLKAGVNAEEFFANNTSFESYRRLAGTPDQFVATLAGGKGDLALDTLNQLQAAPPAGAQWIEPNFYQNWQKYYTPNDARFGNQWHMHNIGQGGALVDADSDLPEAWDFNQGGSPDYVIGIVDDSVASHPDLELWVNAGEIDGNGIDDDGNGWIDDVHGWNFVSNNNSSGPTTDNDVHGTAVAGVAAAKGDNSIGVAGASFNSLVSSARIFEGFSVASDAAIAGALYYMGGRTADGLGTWKSADIVNNSWGGGGVSTAITNAVAWGASAGRLGLGAPIFFAAGNTFGPIIFPATLAPSIPGVFAIGATNSGGTRSDYSAFGDAVNFVAPSNDTRTGFLAIDTTDRVGANGYDPSDYTGTGANGFGGTSSATPLAVGITALVMDQADDLEIVLSPGDLEKYLNNTTDLIGGVSYDMLTGKQLEYGHGRLNAATAVSGIGKAEISVLHSAGELANGVGVVDWGTTYVGQIAERTFRVRNQGTSTLDLTSLSISSGVFQISTGLSDSALSIGESAIFTISFNPEAVGSYSATVTLNSNDSDEASFTFDVTGTALVRSISGYVVEDWDGDGQFDPQDNPVSGRIVYIDDNDNGVFDSPVLPFTQSTPTNIFDVTTVFSTLEVSGLPNPITDVDVMFNITHTWVSDLDVWLTSPAGTRILLFSDVGGSGDNFTGTTLDDDALTSISSGSAPFTGTYRPADPLATFNGTNPNGTWTLEIVDFFFGDEGSVDNWTLAFATGSTEADRYSVTDADGYYFFEGLFPDSYELRSQSVPGWEATGDNLQLVTLTSPDDFVVNVDFGTAKNDRFYGVVFDDENTNGIFDSTESPLEGRGILIDENGNGVVDIEDISRLSESAVPIQDFAIATSTVTVSGESQKVITDVNLRLNITHTYVEDLYAYLIHPDGTRISLFTNVGGAGENFEDTVFDDQAETSIFSGSAPFSGSFVPQQLLSTFNGKSAIGTWTLEVYDFTFKDFGALNEWELMVTTSERVLPTDSLGRVAVDFVPGSYDMKLLPQEGWSYTAPPDGLRTVEVTGIPLVNQSFGSTTTQSAPMIAMSMAASSTWTDAFLDFMDGSGTGTGNGLGMAMSVGIAPIMFNDINRIYLQFSEDVSNVSASTIELRDSNGVLPITVNYNSATFVATIAASSPLQAGKYRLAASDAITNSSGVALDGDGIGGPGGIFDFRFDVLPADTNGDLRVNGADLGGFSAAFNTQLGHASYNHMADWNADGRVNGNDLSVFSAFFNRRIDNLPEPGTPFSGGSQNRSRAAGSPFPFKIHDSFFEDLGDEEEEDENVLLT